MAVFMDLKKAFDTVDNSRLILKVERYGIDTGLLKSYLSDRQQFVNLCDTTSGKKCMSCGVPQGSILGPTLFLIYINDIAEKLPDQQILLFADDTSLIIQDKNKEGLIKKANTQLNSIANWFAINRLTIHPQKTNYMIFQNKNACDYDNKILLGNHHLERVGYGCKETTIKYVGILIDDNLSFKEHALHVHKKISQNLYLISANKNMLPFSTRKLLYNALIRPYMEYGAEIWGSKHIKFMNKLQKKCIRQVIKSHNYISHTNQFFRLLQMPKFHDIVKINSCRLAYKLIHLEEPPGLINTLKLEKHKSERRPNDLKVPLIKQRKFDHLIEYSLANIWNSLPANAKEPCLPHTFKERTKNT